MKFRRFLYNLFLPFINRDIIKKYKFLFVFRNFFGKIFIPKTCEIFGNKMFLHKIGHSFELAFLGYYEELETNFIKRSNIKDKIAIDVGACIGYYSLFLSELVGANGKVICFEPELNNYNILNKNISINKLTNVGAVNAAVGNINGNGFLKLSNSPGQHSVFDRVPVGLGFNNISNVDIIRLDDFLKDKVKFSDVTFVKIDVEGSEFEVLKGMENIIKESPDLIVQLEFAPQHLDEHNCDYSEFIKFINENNFSVSYWDLKEKILADIQDLSWLLRPSVIKKFKSGVDCSRNLILRKKYGF